MDYHSAKEYLESTGLMQINPGLDTTRSVLSHLPLDKDLTGIPFIQVAGTNGKGSTSYFLASVLRAAGYRVGLFTSPHLYDVRERITVNGGWIPEAEFGSVLGTVKETAEEVMAKGLTGRMPSYFELTFLAAVLYFSRRRVDAAVLEVGLGGRWDATSVITPEVSVITTISRDHTALLGKRTREIAREKAGIIKKAVPVVCACRTGTVAQREIQAQAAGLDAPYYSVFDRRNRLEAEDDGPPYRCSYRMSWTDSGNTHHKEITHFEINLNGRHQTLNAATAIKALHVFCRRTGISVTPESLRKGLAAVQIPCRIETLPVSPPVIVDGGHNVESVTALTRFLAARGLAGLTLVFGVLADKNYRPMIQMLLPFVGHVVLTRPGDERALPPEKLAPLFSTILDNRSSPSPILVRNRPREAYLTARKWNRDILITGSFYLAGMLRHIILTQFFNEKIQNP